MADIKQKLGLYERKSQTPSSIPQTGKTLKFESFEFQELDRGVYVWHDFQSDIVAGEKHAKHYFPLQLTGIMELSLWPRTEALHPEEVLFLDTETTGLNRGAGNYPFLTGLAYIRNGHIHTEEVFLSEPSGEPAYLNFLNERFKEFRYLVSYNGKSFDIPLIKTRFIMNRRRDLPRFLHFDLLHIFRRLFPARSLPGYRQQDLERELLNATRTNDLPGAEIPQIYFDYVKYGQDMGLARVFEHNRLDLHGLVLLFLEAIALYDARNDARPALRSGIARILLRNKREDEALALLEDVLSNPDTSPKDLRYRDLLLLAQLYRRRSDYDRALATFQHVVDRYDCCYARMSSARLLEHRMKDFDAALVHTECLLSMLDPRHGGAATGPYTVEELKWRQQRLLRKRARLSNQIT